MSYSFPRIPTAFYSRFLLSSILLTGCLSSVNAAASTQSDSISPSNFGGSISGLFSNSSIGYGDAMIPLFGRSTNFFYIDPQILFHTKDDYAGSLGFGKRWLQSDQAGILGAYVFADYSHSTYNNSFWFVSPGVERLGKTVDFSANLYIPVSNQRIYNGTFYGNQLGIYDYVHFQGNSQFDQLFNSYESVGIGGDAEVGFRLPFRNNPKIYVGGYYFSPKDSQNIRGGTLRLEVPVSNRLTLSVSDGYDNVTHNTFKVGITYNFGSRHNSFDFKGDLADRMMDPIHRNLASVAGGATATQPISTTNTPTGTEGEEYSNITFFNANGDASIQDGTYEHPYIQFNQGNVDTANLAKNTMFYVGSGTYSSNSTITLTNDSIWGRQAYNGNLFVHPAQGDNRPLFDFSGMTDAPRIGAYTPSFYVIQNGSDVTFDSIRLVGNPTANNDTLYQSGIQVVNTSATPVNLTFNNVDVSAVNIGSVVYNNGAMNNLTVSNSSFHDTVNYGDGFDMWINGVTKNITVDNSHFDNNTFSGMDIYVPSGVVNNINIKNSSFDNNGSESFGPGSGLFITTQTTSSSANPTILNTTIDSSTFNGNAGYGFQVLNNSGSTGNFDVSNSQFNNNETGIMVSSQGTNGNAYLGNINISNSTVDNNTTNRYSKWSY